MGQYDISTPGDNSVKPEIKRYLDIFYQTSDTPDAHQKYAESFTRDATLIMGANEAKGRDQILATRKGMWEKVSGRSHAAKQVFAYGKDSNDVMLYGTVEYTLKDGRKSGADWGAHAHFAEEDGELKMDFYQVYVDLATAMAKAK